MRDYGAKVAEGLTIELRAVFGRTELRAEVHKVTDLCAIVVAPVLIIV